MGKTREERKKLHEAALRKIRDEEKKKDEREAVKAAAAERLPAEREAYLQAMRREDVAKDALADAAQDRREAWKLLSATLVTAGQPVRPRKPDAQGEAD